MTLRPVAGCNDVRVHLPCRELALQPGVRIAIQEASADLPLAAPGEDSVFLWQRPILRDIHLEALRRLIARGYVVVVEFDDHPGVWPDIAAHGNLNFRGVHAVQTSTDALAGMLRRYNPNIAVFRMRSQLPPLRVRDDEVVTLFFGALRRERDWAPIMPALNTVLRECGERVRVKVVHDKAFHDALATANKSFHPTLPYDEYLKQLATADINLLPLLDGEFRRMKSDVNSSNPRHGAVAGEPDGTPLPAHGETGMIFRTPKEFRNLLSGLISDPGRRKALAQAAWDYVRRERLLAGQTAVRLAWYRDLCARREQLTRELCERVPELRA
jgi:hypothetical protein